MFGDSGIGKTTLLRSLCEVLPGDFPQTLVGFYSVEGGESDPLLWSLDSLLKGVYTLENWLLQIPTAWTNLTHKVSQADLSDLRKFLTKIVGEGKPESSLGMFGNSILSVVGRLGTAISSLDAKIDETLLRPQDIKEFCRVISLLSDALPDRTIVLVIDNLNAASRTAIETIEAYLSQHSNAFPSVHLILSWKRESDNANALHHLKRRIGEYGGESIYLEHITSRQAINDWLQSEFCWFGELTDKQRQSVINLTGGLPEVIVRWKTHSLDNFNEEVLARIAEEVRDGKYSELAEKLGEAEPADQRLLYALALVDRPMSVQALAGCFSLSYEECRKRLQKWSLDNFVLRSTKLPDEFNQIPFYTYDHDSKRMVALKHLPAELGDARRVAETLYAFLLRNFGSNEPGFAKFLSMSEAMSEHAGAPADQRAEISDLVALINTGRPPGNKPWRFDGQLPENAQIHFLAYSMHTGYGDREEILKAVARISMEVPNVESEALARASGIAHIVQHLHHSELGPDFYLKLLRYVQAASDKFDRSEPFSFLLSKVLSTYSYVCGEDDESKVLELADLMRRFPWSARIAGAWAQMIQLDIFIQSKGGKQVDARVVLPKLDQLRELRERFPKSFEVATFSGTALWLLADAQIKLTDEQRFSILADLRILQANHTESISLAEELAFALWRISPDFWSQEPRRVECVLAEMRSLRSRYPNERGVLRPLRDALESAWFFMRDNESDQSVSYFQKLSAEREEVIKECPKLSGRV